MAKLKVKDIANDLGVTNKKITEILEKYCGVAKKTASAVTDEEVGVVIDVITQQTQVENFDKYLASRGKKAEENQTVKAEKPAKSEHKEEKTAQKSEKKHSKDNKKSEKPADKKQEKVNTNVGKKAENQPISEEPVEETHTRSRRVIDTRAVNVDVERYNAKYDEMANDSSKGRNNDNTMKKQKFICSWF